MKEPEISVGIVSALAIQFTLNGHFTAKGSTVCDRQDVAFHEGGILWNGNIYHELTFSPLEKSCSFSLENVTIGIERQFHLPRHFCFDVKRVHCYFRVPFTGFGIFVHIGTGVFLIFFRVWLFAGIEPRADETPQLVDDIGESHQQGQPHGGTHVDKELGGQLYVDEFHLELVVAEIGENGHVLVKGTQPAVQHEIGVAGSQNHAVEDVGHEGEEDDGQ